MMRYLLTFLLLVGTCAATQAQVITVGVAPQDAPSSTTLRMPNGTTNHTALRGHFLLTASDMGQIPVGIPLTHIGMNYNTGTDVPAGGTLRFYVENTSDNTNLKSTTWTAAIASMALVYDGTWSLPVGTTESAAVDVTLDNTFTYSGNSLYIAYEYLGSTFAEIAALNTAQNSAMANKLRMAASTTPTLPATLATGTSFIPQMRFSYANPYDNELAVEALSVPFGYFNKLWGDGSGSVATVVANLGALNQSNIPVTIRVSGANTHEEIHIIPALAGGDSTSLTVSDLTYPNTGTQTITVSVPADERPENDEMNLVQVVSCDAVSYTGAEVPYDAIGFNTGSGILATRYTAPPVPVTITGINVEISNQTNNLGKTVGGRLLDSAGQILASSEPVVLGAEHLGQRVSFPLITAVDLEAGADFYSGLFQSVGTPGYFPVATAEPAISPAERHYAFPASGGTGTQYTTLGNFKMGANLLPRVDWIRSPTGDIEQGQTVTFTASNGFTDYDFMVNGTSVQQGTSREFSYQPADGDVVSLAVSRHGCDAAPADAFTLTVFTREVTGSPGAGVDDITAGFNGGGNQCSFSSASFIPVSDVPVAPPSGVNLPYGLFQFVAENCTAEPDESAATLNLTITYPNTLPAGTQYWKYHPDTQEWFVLPGAVIAGNQIQFTLVDGGTGDTDNLVNGIIRDPGGPGIRSTSGAVPAPTLSLWGLLLLSGLLAGLGATRLRHGYRR